MPNHDEEPDKEFDDSFKLFALKLELKEAINNPKGTKSEKEKLKQYIELLENEAKYLDKKRLEAETRVPSLSDGAPLPEAQKEGRPTYKNEIQEVGQSLLDRAEIDPATPWKKIAGKVRKLVQESVGTSDNRGLSDQTIRRHLKAIFDAHGKTRG